MLVERKPLTRWQCFETYLLFFLVTAACMQIQQIDSRPTDKRYLYSQDAKYDLELRSEELAMKPYMTVVLILLLDGMNM